MNATDQIRSTAPELPATPAHTARFRFGRRDAGFALLVVGAAIAAYLPALHGGFVWDDDGHITKPALRSLAGLRRIWFDVTATQQYYPVLHSAFWIEHRLWGDAVVGYHAINVLLHATAACLLACVLRRLSVPGAWLAAGLFALHPVHVESVAWITEQKNTLALVFYLGAALAYLRFDAERRSRFYFAALGLFLLGLGSKTVTATLPAALLVVCWWRRGRVDWRRDGLPLVPWLVAGAVAGLLTAAVERKLIGAEGVDFDLSLASRALLAGRIVWFYLSKLLWPADLIFVYPRWNVAVTSLEQWLFPLAAVAALAAAWILRRRTRAPLAVGLLFVGSLFPVLGFLNVYPFVFSYVADHFQYVPSLAIVSAAAAIMAVALDRAPAARTWLKYVVPAALLGTLGTLTWRQAHAYRDAETLYRTTIARNPNAWLALNNLGFELHAIGRDAEALACYERALRLRPDNEGTRNNLGVALAALGRFPEAIAQYEQALQRRPDYAEAHHNLALALTNAGRAKDALSHYGAAMRCQDAHPEIYSDWGFIFGEAGRLDDAVAQCQRAVKLGVRVADAEKYWAVALANAGRFEPAMVHFRRAVELQGSDATTYANFGKCLQMSGRAEEAIDAYERALRLQPANPEVLNNLGLALRAVGRTQDAAARFESALRLQPTAAALHVNLALCLRDLGRHEEARAQIAEARRLDPSLPREIWPD